MDKQENKRQRIYELINAETKTNIFVYGPYQAQTWNPLITLNGALWKQNKCNFPSKYWFTTDCYSERWNKMSEAFILNASKSYRNNINTII